MVPMIFVESVLPLVPECNIEVPDGNSCVFTVSILNTDDTVGVM